MVAKIAIFTTEEARGRLCCGPPGVGYQPGARREVAENRLCAAERCMAWRWYATHVQRDGPGTDFVPDGETYGYCGLGGSPEPKGGI